MQIQSNIQRKMRALARQIKPKLTEADLYRSYEMRRYLERLALTICTDEWPEDPGRREVIISFASPEVTACTDGNTIRLNPDAAVVRYYDTPELRFSAFQGLFFHEMAHVVFLDFEAENRAIRSIRNGRFYGGPPKGKGLTPQELSDWQEMTEALSNNPQAARLFVNVYRTISNVISDVHDEDRLINRYGSWAGEGIYLLRSSQRYRCGYLEDLLDMMNSGKLSALAAAFDLILQLARTGEVKARESGTLKASPFACLTEKTAEHIRIATETDAVRRRFEEINCITLYLWPFIKDLLRESQGGQDPQNGGNASLSGSLTENAVDKVLAVLQEASEQSGMSTPRPEIRRSSGSAKAGRNSKNEAGHPASASVRSRESFDGMMDGLALGMAETELEQEATEHLRQTIQSVSKGSSHDGVPLRVERQLPVTAEDRNRYERLMTDRDNLRAVSRRLQKQLLDALKDTREGYTQRHRLVGSELDFRDVYRPDGRCFSNKKAPQDTPDMAISVLVDNSGSMFAGDDCGGGYESRIDSAVRAAMLLYDFAEGIGIPVSVAGHCTQRHVCTDTPEEVIYRVFADFDRVTDQDRYRLAKMTAGGSNRDGMALQIASNLLLKRPERIKLLIIISDGLPNAENYSGEDAAEDIRRICRKARAKGIEVIAAAIGNDRENIKDIYRDESLDISDLSRLPKILTDIVKKRVVRSAQ